MATTSTPLPVGPPLREAREQAHLSREQLAQLSGCSTSRIAQFEQGLRPDDSPTLRRVWAVLDALLGADPARGGGA
jgi:transcriptional regulator with XRE-family HTH domain